MKSSLAFDPRDYDYGPPTEAIRSILAEWTEIDWFEPHRHDGDATHLFREHQRLAHAHVPELFPEQLDIRVVSGERDEFTAWCQRVRAQTSWDWKFSVLKELSNHHARARRWTPEAHLARTPAAPPRPGDPFFAFNDTDGTAHFIWNNIVPMPDGLGALSRDGFGESARFYLSYAQTDALECMKWQFAADTADLSTNPFLPLLLCYEAGAYPFSLGPDSAVLFRFVGDAHARN